DGDNVVGRSDRMPWYEGPPLLQHLEQVPAGVDAASKPFRMPVQMVLRPHSEFRGFAGLVVSGAVNVGDRIRVLPSGNESTVSRVLVAGVETSRAVSDQSIV